jgi:hypothetical protein
MYRLDLLMGEWREGQVTCLKLAWSLNPEARGMGGTGVEEEL